jgi:hypothetical protein
LKLHDWPLGLVTRVIRSQDGIVRAALVRTRSEEGHKPSTLTRNVRELVPLTVFYQQKHCPEIIKKPGTINQTEKTAHVIPKQEEPHVTVPKKDTAGYGIKSNRTKRVKVPTILKAREDWAVMVKTIKVGTCVWIKGKSSKGVKKQDWPVGVVQSVSKTRAGAVRSAAVKSGVGKEARTLTSPVQELAPLSVEELQCYETETKLKDTKEQVGNPTSTTSQLKTRDSKDSARA